MNCALGFIGAQVGYGEPLDSTRSSLVVWGAPHCDGGKLCKTTTEDYRPKSRLNEGYIETGMRKSRPSCGKGRKKKCIQDFA